MQGRIITLSLIKHPEILTMIRSCTLNGEEFYYLDSRHFSHQGTAFEIVETSITGPGPMDTTHIVKNTQTGKRKPITMMRLVRILKTMK